MSYLMRVSQTYYVRVVVPPDLRTHFPSKELKRSLRTKQLSEARRLAPAVLATIMSTFQELRSNHMVKKEIITSEAVAIFRRLYPGVDTHMWVDATQDYGGWVVNLGQREVVSPALVKIQERLDEGWQLDASDAWIFVGVGHTSVMAAVAPTPAPVLQHHTPPRVLPSVPKVKGLTLGEAGELWLQHLKAPEDTVHYKPVAVNTLRCSKQALNQLEKWKGKKVAVESLLDIDYKPFTVFMMEKGKLIKSSANTRLRYCGFFFKWLKEFGYTDRMPEMKSAKLQGKEKLKKSNLPYSNSELDLFFNYVMKNTPLKMNDRRTYLELSYLILMFIYTGFRSSEQVSFTKAKIKKAGGIDYFDFTEMTKDTVSAIRMVPVHSKLVELGFLQFTEKQAGKIFKGTVDKYRKIHTETLTALGIKGARGEKTFHSCRSTFDSKLMGKIEDSVRLTLVGHTKAGMDKTYLHQLIDEMQTYKEAVEKLAYDLDFARLKAHLLNEIEVLYG